MSLTKEKKSAWLSLEHARFAARIRKGAAPARGPAGGRSGNPELARTTAIPGLRKGGPRAGPRSRGDPTRPSPRPGIRQLSPSPPAFWRSAPSPRSTAQRHRPARGPPSSASNKARAKGPAAARKWGQDGGDHVGAGRRRWGDGGVRAGEQGTRAGPGLRRGRAGTGRGVGAARRTMLRRAALTCAPGQVAAPPHGPARPTLAPRGPYLLAADAAVHRPAVSTVARSRSRRPQPEPESASPSPLPRRVGRRLPNSQRSRALRQTNCNSRPAPGADGPLRRRGGAGRGDGGGD
ncbi:uncharacterized protein LOC128932059 [Callithrix jacchus]